MLLSGNNLFFLSYRDKIWSITSYYELLGVITEAVPTVLATVNVFLYPRGNVFDLSEREN